ncbi:uncharacterized protein LOC128988909 [Macrosteles quadrilineatus]|uniref:uncharacterized protein LOC128988909 n=1 Tax=Macrosteles quadrilineatus TaxID=74068 RepID=UPI0023E30D2F|nr:uncharacterized protein LOC128988909 [Macrosteles quadrilineatus]
MLRPILLIFCSFGVCDAFVKMVMNTDQKDKLTERLKSKSAELSKTSLEDHGELTCFSETWTETSGNGNTVYNIDYLAKLTNERDGQKFLLDWYEVSDCSDDNKATESIQQVKEVGGDKVEVKYFLKLADGITIAGKSRVYQFDVNQNAYKRVRELTTEGTG